jgi:L-ascorbate metabolism protein UlaG (beta-lactamase superfamily)
MTARSLTLAALALTLTGCSLWPFSHKAPPATDSQQQRLVYINWYGYQCFRIRSTLGLAILTNPFSPGSTDFAEPKGLTPEVILSTSESPDANYVDVTDNTPNILRSSVGIGMNNASGIRILGVPVFRNPESQDASGMNVIYRWSLDGLKFCFLGKLESLPSQQDLSRIGQVDVLFVPVSDTNLTSAQRQQIFDKLRPQIIVPMGSLAAMNRFASGYTSVYRLNGSAALVSRQALPAVPTVLLFRAP